MAFDLRGGAFAVLSLGALALAGCGSQGDTVVAENESVEEVAKKVAKADLRPSPGRWESKMQINSIDMPGMPEQVQQGMKQQLGKVQTSISCLTKEEADKIDGEFFKPEGDSGCKYDSFVMGGGKIDAAMTCQDGQMSQKMTMRGTYGDSAYAMDITADGNVNGKPVSMAMSVQSTRVGECDGTEDS